jgi:hypothetical protein
LRGCVCSGRLVLGAIFVAGYGSDSQIIFHGGSLWLIAWQIANESIFLIFTSQ